jgi:putative flippase GtrA
MRWWKFSAVGALGWVMQTAVLAGLVHGANVHYLPATALAVETTVLHNFLWHRRWTWADRRAQLSFTSALGRFHLSNGLVSILGNLLFMRLLVGGVGLEPILANGLAIAVCAALNYFLCDRFAFLARRSRTAATAAKESAGAAGIASGCA